MKKTILEIIPLFEPQVLPLFGNVKQLPQYGGLSVVYVAQPRDASTFVKMTEIMLGIEPEATIKTSGNIHVLNFSVDTKIVMIYADSQEQMDWFVDYHSYASSIIIGKIFKGSGLKYSEDGLEYIEYNPKINHRAPVGSIQISKDIDRILGILGLNGETFKEGFSTLTEFFDFIIKSDYLRTDKFLSSDKEYKNFTLQEFDKYLTLTGFERTERHEITVDELQIHFPEIDFATRIQELKDKAAAKKEINEKFNGKVVLDNVPELNKETIGDSMGKFKFSFGSKEGYEDFIIQHSREEILDKFRETLIV
jgi:hypothetical protein